MKIVVVINGFVFACREFSQSPDAVTLTGVRCVRVWGTTGGLGELVTGPTKDTKLDALIPVVSVPPRQVLFTFDVTSAWERHLK